jgi:hypothetical protein
MSPFETLTELMVDMNLFYKHIPSENSNLMLYKIEPYVSLILFYKNANNSF